MAPHTDETLRWTSVLESSPKPVQQLANKFLACAAGHGSERAETVDSLMGAAVVARLGSIGLGAARERSSCAALILSAASKALEESLVDADALLREIASWVKLGLAVSLGYGASAEALAEAVEHGKGLPLVVPLRDGLVGVSRLHCLQCRRDGRFQQALLACQVAWKALPESCSSDLRSNVLRQLTVCHLVLEDVQGAEACVALAHEEDLACVDWSRVRLRLACRAGGPGISEAGVFAGLASVAEVLSACRELLDHGCLDAAERILSSVRSRSAGQSVGVCDRDISRLGLRVQLSRAERSTVAGDQGQAIHHIMSHAEAADVSEAAAQVWNMVCRALAAGRPDIATEQLNALQPSSDSTRYVSAQGLVHWVSKHFDEARQCSLTALAHNSTDTRATAVLLLSPHELHDEVRSLQPALQKFTAALFEIVARMAAACPTLVPVSCLRTLAKAAENGWLDVVGWGVEADRAIDSFVGLAGVVLSNNLDEGSACVFKAAAALSSLAASPSRPRITQRVFGFLWNQGIVCGRSGRWQLCAAAFDQAYAALLSAGDAGSLRLAEDAQMCLMAQSAALLEDARGQDASAAGRSEGNPYISVIQATVRARMATDQLMCLRRKQWSAQAPPDKALPLLVLMELEARLACDTGLITFLRDVASKVPLHARCHLVLARMALRAGNREVSMQFLGSYLSAAASPDLSEPVDKYALACRELIMLHGSRNDSLSCFKGALELLRRSPGPAQQYPDREIQWLVAVAWANGVHNAKGGDMAWAREWLGTALSYLDFSPNLACHRRPMSEALQCCTQK